MPPGVPLPPPRRGVLPSNPGTSEGAIWQSLGALQNDVAAVKGGVTELKVSFAGVQQTLANQNAGTRNQTLQILIGGVVAVVTAVAGARLTAPTPPATTTIQAPPSAFDRALVACGKMPSPETQGACIAKLLTDSVAPPR